MAKLSNGPENEKEFERTGDLLRAADAGLLRKTASTPFTGVATLLDGTKMRLPFVAASLCFISAVGHGGGANAPGTLPR